MVSCDTCISGRSGKRRRRVLLICSGLRFSPRQSWTTLRSSVFAASLPPFGRGRRPRARECAVCGRYSPVALRLRLFSRLMVDGLRRSSAAMARVEAPSRRRSAMCIRSSPPRHLDPPAGLDPAFRMDVRRDCGSVLRPQSRPLLPALRPAVQPLPTNSPSRASCALAASVRTDLEVQRTPLGSGCCNDPLKVSKAGAFVVRAQRPRLVLQPCAVHPRRHPRQEDQDHVLVSG